MPNEQRLVDEIREYVRSVNGSFVKVHASGMMREGLPDLLLTFPRIGTIWVETKAPGETPSPIQEAVMREIRTAGGTAFWVDSFQKFLDILSTICHAYHR